MSEGETAAAVRLLLSELDEIVEAASSLQDDAAAPTEASDVRDRYFDWYGRALNMIPTSLEAKFRDFFAGGQFTPRIQAYLSNPKTANPLHDPAKVDNPLAAHRYQYSFEKTFRPNVDGQRQILIEARERITSASREVPSDGDIFIVHGHDEAILHTVARTVRALTNRDPVVLREQPNQGRTIIEKFEAHAAKCSFAIALLTKDDLGHAVSDSDERPRARQNVVFEAGYFVGLIGRRRVALLHQPGVEFPSDLNGIVYLSLTGSWQLELAKELRAAGIDCDLNRLA